MWRRGSSNKVGFWKEIPHEEPFLKVCRVFFENGFVIAGNGRVEWLWFGCAARGGRGVVEDGGWVKWMVV